MNLRVSMIIPTYNRPDDLEKCIASILAQTRLPEELVIVDDGALEEVPLAAACRTAGMDLVYRRKDVPGLTESRNLGKTVATGDIVCYLDDDTVLFPDYLEQLLDVYRADDAGHVLAVGGLIANPKPKGMPHHLRYILDLLVMNRGVREGRVLPSGFCTDYNTTWFTPRTVRDVDFLDGGVSSFRASALVAEAFTAAYRNWGLGEDKDFTYRLARKGRVVLNPQARLHHFEATVMRPDKRSWGRKFVLGRFLFFRDLVLRHPWEWLFFWYALAGYALIRFGITLLSGHRGEWDRMRGIFQAIGEIIRGQVPVLEKLEVGEK